MSSTYGGQEFNSLDVQVDGKVLVLSFTRPADLNPLDPVTLGEIGDCVERANRDQSIEIIELRGPGRAFSAGGDLKNHLSVHQDALAIHEMGRVAARAMDNMIATEKLVIAFVDGLCVAGGLELVLCCDFVIATERASFSDGHLNVALLPGSGGTQRLPRWTGALRAKELMLTARFIGAEEALAIGLVSYFWRSEDVEERRRELIDGLLKKSFASRAAIKYLINQSNEMPLSAGIHLERAFVQHFETTHPDAHEGILAFVEKRRPAFRKPG
jgi:enoyl-CoA hydratase/carnithine racemase